MPKPLILFEHHFSSAAKDFIIENIKHLKAMGYHKLLWEMDRSLTPYQLRQQLRKVLATCPTQHPVYILTKSSLDMLDCLEKHNFNVLLIDPETQSEGELLNRQVSQAKNEDELKKAYASKQAAVIRRDNIMAQDITKEMKQNSGLIYLGGYMHKHLVTLLTQASKLFRFAILADSRDSFDIVQGSFFRKLADETFRYDHFQTEVYYLDLAKKLPFYTIENAWELSNSAPCELPTKGKYFNKVTGLQFNYLLDDQKVVTAVVEFPDKQVLEEAVINLNKTFPGLYFFSQNQNGRTFLKVPGFNLPEYDDLYRESFVKHGVMQK